MKELVCLVAVGLTEIFSVNCLYILVEVALTERTVFVVLVKSGGTKALEVNEVAY